MTSLHLCLLIIFATFAVAYAIMGLMLGLVWVMDKIFKKVKKQNAHT